MRVIGSSFSRLAKTVVFSFSILFMLVMNSVAGNITGTVTGPDGSGLAGIEIRAYEHKYGYSNTFNAYLWEWKLIKYEVYTDGLGRYNTGNLPAGTYRIEFSDDWNNVIYLSKTYNNASDLDSGDDIDVPAVGTVSNINASLDFNKLTPVHRFWSHQFGSHFYIMGDSERDRIEAKYPGIWNYEAVAWYAYPQKIKGTEPVHRFWSDRLGKHFYIMGDTERDRIIVKYRGIWNYEAVAWYAYPNQVEGTDPVGRFWSDAFMGHFYIITQPEINRIKGKYPGIWNYEAVAYYAYQTLPSGKSSRMSDEAKAFAGNADDALSQKGNYKTRTSTAVSDMKNDASSRIDIVYPLTILDGQVSAYVYDSTTERWTCVLPATNSPAAAVLENAQPDCSYLLDVLAGDSGDEMTSVHQSAFTYQFDPPETIHEDSDAVAQENDVAVGSPIARIKTPVVDDTLTVKLYSSSQGVVKTLKEVPGGETVELSIPDWNRWYWVGGWRDADNELVLSIWLRHETAE